VGSRGKQAPGKAQVQQSRACLRPSGPNSPSGEAELGSRAHRSVSLDLVLVEGKKVWLVGAKGVCDTAHGVSGLDSVGLAFFVASCREWGRKRLCEQVKGVGDGD
jgi:hypothetical protein